MQALFRSIIDRDQLSGLSLLYMKFITFGFFQIGLNDHLLPISFSFWSVQLSPKDASHIWS